MITLPVKFSRGAKGIQERQTFVNGLLAIQETIDFKVSCRGWCYILEEHGLLKGSFDRAQKVINDCRKNGMLPYDFTASDQNRETKGIEPNVDSGGIDSYCNFLWEHITAFYIKDYLPLSFWDNQKYYVEMVGEKIDLKTLFAPVCERWNIPYTNSKGWSDINSRGDMMNRLRQKEDEGRQCVVLYCGDHDPGGMAISDMLRKNLADLAEAKGIMWYPDEIIIERFGLNSDFIKEHNLSWIENLETSSGKRLDDPRHSDHNKDYVQYYLREYGARKVEANALIVRPEAGRKLCEEAILKYIDRDAAEDYEQQIEHEREQLRSEYPGYVNRVNKG